MINFVRLEVMINKSRGFWPKERGI